MGHRRPESDQPVTAGDDPAPPAQLSGGEARLARWNVGCPSCHGKGLPLLKSGALLLIEDAPHPALQVRIA